VPDQPQREERSPGRSRPSRQPAASSPEVAGDWSEALTKHRQGDLAAAERAYRRVLERSPEHPGATNLLAAVLLQQGRHAEAVPLLQRLLQQHPDLPDAHNSLGIALKALNRPAEAAACFHKAVELDPSYPQAWYNLGVVLTEAGRPAEAEACLRRAAGLRPDDPDARWRLAGVLCQQQKWAEAEAEYRRMLERRPDHLDALVNLAVVLVHQERLEEASECFHRVLQLRPNYAEVHSNLAYVAERQGRLDESLRHARKAVELNPNVASNWNNLGVALRELHRLDEAAQAFQRALQADPAFALAEFNLATTWLLAGDYKRGWPGYERRYEAVGQRPPQLDRPRWRGEPRPGQTLLVYTDQGAGDAIQFVRFLPLAKRRSQARILLRCPAALHRLFRTAAGADQVLVAEPSGERAAAGTATGHERSLSAGGTVPSEVAFECHVPLSSLPVVLNVSEPEIRPDEPYLAAPPLSEPLRQLLDDVPAGTLRVGLVWQGNPAQDRDRVRSVRLSTLLPLADVPGVTFFSLQVGAGREQLAELADRWPLVDLAEHLHDFADTAAVLAKLDFLVTVDTAAAHLAGALGRPAWVLLCHTPDWRWLLDRDDSPWYPSLRLFRQPKRGDWAAVVEAVREELKRLAEQTRSERSESDSERPEAP